MKSILTLFCLFVSLIVLGQKKPLDHSVYDGWESIGEKLISNDGQWVVFTITPQEGDNELVIASADGKYRKTVARGYNAIITEDSRFAIFRIKPFFKDVRDARIRKKKADDLPKDSLGIVMLGNDNVWKSARVKSYKVPTDGYGWVAYHQEKTPEPASRTRPLTSDPKKISDSLLRVIDSLHGIIAESGKKKEKKKNKNKDGEQEYNFIDAEGDDPPGGATDAGTNLVLRKLVNGEQKIFRNVLDYVFSRNGDKLLVELARDSRDSASKAVVLLHDLRKGYADTIIRGGNDFKNFSFSDDGMQLAFLAERDSKPKDLQKIYKLWHYRVGMDSAIMLVDKNTIGMRLGFSVSEFGNVSFSKSGRRLFFGTSPILPPKDTSLVDIDLVKVDVWHYSDDYLQTSQLSRLNRDLQENFQAVYLFDSSLVRQLGSKELPVIYPGGEGDGNRFAAVTDFGKRIESQWIGNTLKDVYAIDVNTGERKLVKDNLQGTITSATISPTGDKIMWYDRRQRNYFVYDGDSTRNVSGKIKSVLYDEDHDTPNEPPPYGVMGWHEGDSAVYVYDRYDVWKLDLINGSAPVNVTQSGRASKTVHRYLKLDAEERFIKANQPVLFRVQNENTKDVTYLQGFLGRTVYHTAPSKDGMVYAAVVKAKDADRFIYTKENYKQSPDIYVSSAVAFSEPGSEIRLSHINKQQEQYNWGTSELYKWKAFDGRMAEGILYKPENFDPKKKYPMIMYFYETYSNTLHQYLPPTPTGSRLNIPFFVSRGYLVFVPDIHYKVGYPARGAYNYVVSAAKDLSKHSWVDSKNIGIQGQSWGGIQVAQLVTMTDMFKAAWAGAPVANMTSAYGGIRWESGVNRQFQYEKEQSRIGASLWEKPELYIENSPLFHLPKVKTPLVIMSNDADGAVPWYQGIELFTAMRRLGKKVWLLNYNGEAHNLVERKNKKDIQIRQQQYFDWLLKGDKPPKWLVQGIPAVQKGRDWGFELVD